eukprot:TRINITY_DN4699_c0_g1_i1.p1 TRINITY_DN4699_c0_g1~~TRINITY_DN4699_c0_g1_i1.p1  ORF type:complete len:1525 (-),score=579.22 TRINITY_DN4699_c0_g1_i1:81-4655(-)
MGGPSSLQISSVAHGSEVIKVGSELLEWIPSDIVENVPSSSYVLITDVNLLKIHASKLISSFQKTVQEKTKGKSNFIVKVIEAGESSKCRSVKAEIEDWMISNGCGRDSCMIAFGGGVIGDLTGFIASTYMRGVPVVQIPTTLLAMVDSSIGGKTGIDTHAAKNIVGSFHHPKLIYIDTFLLKTLPKREFSNGMAEVIKTAAIRDAGLFEILENNTDRILDERNQEILQQVVLRTGGIKAHVVSIDEKESGLRSILNFGHTIGHAIEALVTPELLHGECVSIGMVLETQLSYKMGHLKSTGTIGRLLRCLASYKLPLHLPKYLTAEDLFAKMTLDKKNIGKKIRTTILLSIGSTIEVPVPVDNEKLYQVLMPHISVVPKRIEGEISVPGSKSLSNRVLPVCGLGEGTCKIKGLLQADDTRVMLDSLKEFGIEFHWEDDGTSLILKDSGEKKGPAKFKAPSKPLFLGNAGTASRFLTTLANMVQGPSVLTGSQRMKERPIRDLTDALTKKGCNIQFLEKDGFFPIQINGSSLPGGVIDLSANVSSQFVSSILLSAPYASSPVELRLHDGAVSRPFIDMTTALMAQFGVKVETPDENTYLVPLGSYKNPPEFTIESDASSASYPLALAAITGGKVTVHNIGSKSIQGDAKFYTVLESMGCVTSQTDTSTTVTGPKDGRLKAISVNMDFMTDTFMTLCAVAVLAEGTTVITGIANQRVKECNRIAAMVTEMSKLGVVSRELEDGLEIDGVAGDISKLHGGEIECYLDHRIAMSFAVLGSRVPGIVILDKECVDKTYPEFWMDLETKFGVTLEVPPLSSQSKVNLSKSKSILLIGMRGSGKSSMGKSLASDLGWKSVDLDEEFLSFASTKTLKEFVETNGWPAFRQKEEQLLHDVIKRFPNETVISTGGGIIETASVSEFLKKYEGLVVQVSRNTEDVIEHLNVDKSRVQLGEDIQTIWNRRSPIYTQNSKLEFHIRRGENNWKESEKSFSRLISRFLGREETKDISKLDSSFFLSLTAGQVEDLAPLFPQIVEGVQAVELRVDLLKSREPEFVKEQVARLQSLTLLPIIFTVRSIHQGGKFEGKPEEYFRLNELGLRLGVEWVDVEACHPLDQTTKFLETVSSFSSRVILSYHDFESVTSEPNYDRMLQSCLRFISLGHVVKLVGFSRSSKDNFTLFSFVNRIKSSGVLKGRPLIAINAGESGKLTRIVNLTMTPVTHPNLTLSAAAGQLSVQQINTARDLLGTFNSPEGTLPGNFYLFGTPISASKSPLIHNTGFKHHNMKHVYDLFETDSVEKVVLKLREKTTLGGSVTIPHKQSIFPYLDKTSEAAQAIGAVNTITKLSNGGFAGDNTDWVAIDVLLQRNVKRTEGKKPLALLIGAGGTSNAVAYVLSKSGYDFFIWNRTVDKAEQLAERFKGGKAVSSLEELELGGRKLDVVIGTVPPTAQFSLPTSLLHSGLVAMELVYNPRETTLLRQVKEAGGSTIEGIEILFEQGLVQFEIFSGKQAPRRQIGEALLSTFESNKPNLHL